MLLGVLFAMSPATTAAANSTGPGVVHADPSPSPTLGSTESPNPNPPGAQDPDANDYSGATWVVIGAGVAALLIVAGTLFWFRGRRRGANQ